MSKIYMTISVAYSKGRTEHKYLVNVSVNKKKWKTKIIFKKMDGFDLRTNINNKSLNLKKRNNNK